MPVGNVQLVVRVAGGGAAGGDGVAEVQVGLVGFAWVLALRRIARRAEEEGVSEGGGGGHAPLSQHPVSIPRGIVTSLLRPHL